MSKEREAELLEGISKIGHSQGLQLLKELLVLRRERHMLRLEKEDSPETRGRSQECRDLLNLF